MNAERDAIMAKIADIIKYEGGNDTFIWKHPSEDFNTLSQLIVHESQEAVFFMNGQALDLFGPGRHTLTTQNLPIIGKALNLATGGETPFHCEVYFINKTVQMGIKWGTDSRVRFIEPTLGVPLEIGASGELNLAVADSRKLLVKLVGTMNGIAWGERGGGFTKSIQDSFRPLISTAVKTHLATSIKAENIDILEIDSNLEKLSVILREAILPGFEEYGLTVPQFYVSNVLLPEGDANLRKLRELKTVSLDTKMVERERQIELERQATETEIARRKAERELIDAQAKAEAAKMAGFAEAQIMQAKGYTQKDVFQTEVQKAYAEGIGNMGGNGGGGIVGDFVGLGVGMAAAGNVTAQMGDLFKGLTPTAEAPAETAASVACPNCGSSVPAGAKFCLECGTKIEILADDEMLCPACGKKVKKGKFCLECGASLIRKCPKCEAEVPTGAKFCLECGEKL